MHPPLVANPSLTATSTATESRDIPSAARVEEALRGTREELRSQILLWQRTIRYGAVVVLALASAVVLKALAPDRSWLPLAAAAGGYVIIVAVLSAYQRIASGIGLPAWVPAAIAIADIVMVTAVVYFSVPPEYYHLILLFSYLVVQFTVFYFGWISTMPAALLSIGAYVLVATSRTPYLPGMDVPGVLVAVNALLYAFVISILMLTLGTFRERLGRLRTAHKRVEIGDLGANYPAERDTRMDDLTLVGHGFNEMRDRIAELIGTDPLTGCLNRRSLESRLHREWRQAKRRNSSVALLAIDIDYFKVINDSHGHPAGDAVLRDLGDIFRHTARETDVVGRLGGDEFVILLPDTGWQGAMTFAERLRRSVDEHPFGDDQGEVTVTLSIGVATQKGSDPNLQADHLMEAADRSLYRAKSEGRNRICA